MTRGLLNKTICTMTLMLGACVSSVFAEPQKMVPMTTVSSSSNVQFAQANTPRNADLGAKTGDFPTNLAPTAGGGQTSQPASTATQNSQYLVVQQLAGKVMYSELGADSFASSAWKPVRVGDRLGAGIQIRTCMPGGSVKLVLDPSEPPTVMAIEPGSIMAVEELALQNGISKTRFALGVGTVKAGVAESGDTSSDMQITTPTGTLSKKGTDIFSVSYVNGRFRMSLSEQGRGLIQATQLKWGNQGNLIASRSRFVTAGQFVTQEMFKAIDHVKFDREININDLYGQTGNELLTFLNNRGLTFLAPWGSNTVNFLGSPDQQPTDGMTGNVMGGVTTTGLGRATPRREGDFGIGQTLLPFRQASNGLGQKTVRTRQQHCGGDTGRQCKTTTRIMKRRM